MTQETDNSTTTFKPPRGRSLRSKLLLPFIVIIALVGGAVTFGSIQQIKASFTKSSDERLLATQEVLFREFKKQEIILQTYATLLQHFQSLAERFSKDDEIGILQDRLYGTLEEADISVTFYPIEIISHLPQESINVLFEQVRRSGKPRFRYSNEMGSLPVLMVAAPLYKADRLSKIMLLYTAMGQNFLRKITEPMNVHATLMNIEGEVLAASRHGSPVVSLTPAQISALGRGERLSLTRDIPGRTLERIQISAIPLGSTDIIFLSLSGSLKESGEAQSSIILKLAIIIISAFLLGLIIYMRMISKITHPARELCHAAEAISRGNFNYKVVNASADELGQVAAAFNSMVDNLEHLQQKRCDKEITRALGEAETKLNAKLEKKDLDLKKVEDELTSMQREISAIYQLNQAMISSTELPMLFDRVMQVINETLGCDQLVLLVYNAGDSSLEVAKTAGVDFDLLRDIKFTFDQGITGEVARNQRLVYVKDLDKDTRNLSYHGQIVTRGSMVSVPLTVKGRLVGALNLHKKQVDAFKSSDLKLAQAIANQTAIAIDNSQLQEKSRDLISTDELTGLANRRHFQDILKREVAQARRFSSNFSIIMGDIDHFKKVNDAYGRMHADAVLRQVGQTLLKNTRGIDLVCRFGTEQFVIMLPKTDKTGAIAAAEKLRRCIATTEFDVGNQDGEQIHLTMSFGVTEFPADSKNIYELLNLADRALYAAKNEGRDRTVAWEGPAPGPD